MSRCSFLHFLRIATISISASQNRQLFVVLVGETVLWSLEAGVKQASQRRGLIRVLFPTGSGRAKGKVTQTHRKAHACSHPDMSRPLHCLLSIIGPFRRRSPLFPRLCCDSFTASLQGLVATALSRNHANIPVFRVTGFSSPTKVVLMLVMSMRRLRSFSFLSTSLNILQMKKSPQPS